MFNCQNEENSSGKLQSKIQTISIDEAKNFLRSLESNPLAKSASSEFEHLNFDEIMQEKINGSNQLKNNFPGLYDYYEKRWKPTWNHEMMANHYRSTIADIIQQFDNNRLSRSTYEAVAWLGLGKLDTNVTTIAWDNVSPEQKAEITKLINEHFYKGPTNCN